MEDKYCNKCGEFNPHYVLKNGKPYSWCQPCVRSYQKLQYRKHIDSHRRRNARAHKQRKYGLSSEDFSRIFEAQEGKCAICFIKMTKPAVDHDHKSGKIRGLLCSKCNSGIGLLKDSPEILQSAINYLKAVVGGKVYG